MRPNVAAKLCRKSLICVILLWDWVGNWMDPLFLLNVSLLPYFFAFRMTKLLSFEQLYLWLQFLICGLNTFWWSEWFLMELMISFCWLLEYKCSLGVEDLHSYAIGIGVYVVILHNFLLLTVFIRWQALTIWCWRCADICALKSGIPWTLVMLVFDLLNVIFVHRCGIPLG